MLRKLFKLPKKVTIEWSNPKKVDDVLNAPTLKEEIWGLYQISTKIDEDKIFLYIGKSWKDYHKRLKAHRREWFDQYEGEKYVRFGSFLTSITEIQLDEVESAIIFQTKLPKNIQSVNSYSVNHDYIITSTGKRGIVPQLINTEEH
jgi:hypothetical protein